MRYVREDNVSDNDDQEDDMPFGMYDAVCEYRLRNFGTCDVKW